MVTRKTKLTKTAPWFGEDDYEGWSQNTEGYQDRHAARNTH